MLSSLMSMNDCVSTGVNLQHKPRLISVELCKLNPIEKLQRVSRTVRVVAGICLALKSYVKEGETKQWSLVEMQLNLQADLKDSLAFDINLFKKFRVTRGSEKLKNILLTKPADRTNEEIQVVMALLRKNKTFQEYPTDVQLELIKGMVYQRYEARRIILKQGHRPFAFYIILSGTCLINVQEIDSETRKKMVRTVREITTGDHFGEVAFMNKCDRTASVVCKDDVELLVILAEDFNRIIREPLEKKREDHIEFCKTLDIFRSWPVDKLRENSQAFTYQYFIKDAVMVKNAKESNNIIIIKSGSCKVVAQIHELKSRRRPRSGGHTQSQFPLIEIQKRREAMMPRSLSVVAPRELNHYAASDYKAARSTTPQQSKSKPIRSRLYDSRPLQRPTVPKSTLEVMTGKKLTQSVPSLSIPKSDKSDQESSSTEESGPSAEKKVKFPHEGVKRTWKRLQIATKTLQLRDGQKQKPLLVHPSRVRIIYAQIATMSRGAVFGLEQSNCTNLSLISEGCECLLLSKKLFITEANSQVMQSLSILTNVFPTPEDTLQEIKRAREWKKYKGSVVKDVVSRTPRNFTY
ncbi:uncharacterized protein LOC144439121 isoform X2 [Glandiceps talaboti]